MLRRLKIKIICISMAIVTIMLCVIFGTVYHFTSRNLELESIRMMETMSAGSFRPGRPDAMPGEIRLPYFAVQLDREGRIMEVSGGYYDLSDAAFLRELCSGALAERNMTGVLEDYKLRYLCRFSPEGQSIIFADISSERAALSSFVQTGVLIGLLSLLVFFGISVLLAKLAVKPVEKVWEQQRRFVADASHELKTPLTVIITNTELMKSGDYGPEEKERFLDSIQTVSQQMRGLTEDLLALARVDAGVRSSEVGRVDLSGLVDARTMVFEPLYFENGLCLSAEVEENISLTGAEPELRRVVDILLDNAMKYSRSGSEVKLQLKRQGGSALLSVDSEGEEISPENLKNIFERFYRGDKARSMNHSYGLGLPIAREIVLAHRGRIWAESAGGVNRFNVLLPI